MFQGFLVSSTRIELRLFAALLGALSQQVDFFIFYFGEYTTKIRATWDSNPKTNLCNSIRGSSLDHRCDRLLVPNRYVILTMMLNSPLIFVKYIFRA